MAKFYGTVGYVETVETAPGVWMPQSTERNYYGDILKNTSKWRNNENVNPDLVIDNRVSIVADEYAEKHFHAMKYVIWKGVRWQIIMAEPQRPRIILSLGGVYNAQQ